MWTLTSKPRSSWPLDNTCGNVCMTVPYCISPLPCCLVLLFSMLINQPTVVAIQYVLYMYCISKFISYNIMLFHISFDVTSPPGAPENTRWQSITCLMEQRLRAYGLGTSRGCKDGGMMDIPPPKKKGTFELMNPGVILVRSLQGMQDSQAYSYASESSLLYM